VPTLAVIGNISRDVSAYPDGRRHANLGGAALHIALAAARAGLDAAPVSVIGNDLSWIFASRRLQAITLESVAVVNGASCAFHLTYDERGDLVDVTASYAAAEHLTGHVLRVLDKYQRFHVCCRRPLDAARVLPAIIERGAPFTVDFMTSSAADYLPAVAHLLSRAAMVLTSDAEHQLLTAALDPGTLPAVTVTRGAGTTTLYRYGQPSATAQPPPIVAVDLTGAGDTFTGRLLAALAAGAADQDALSAAVAAASKKVAFPQHVLPPPASEE